MKNNKFTNDLNDTPLHTSVFAEAAGSGFGSTSTESFEERMKLQRSKRRLVQRYGDSMVGRGHGDYLSVRVPKRSVERADGLSRQSFNSVPSASDTAASSPKPSSFREPPSRGFNPYA